MTLSIPPLYDVLIDEDSKANLNWTIFFQNIAEGDSGDVWSPTFINLGTSGSPTYTGRYYQISKYICFFTVTIFTNGGNTTSTAGTTYIDNFPLIMQSDSVCFVGTGSGAVQAIGGIRSADKRIYPPGWSSVTENLTIVGIINTVG